MAWILLQAGLCGSEVINASSLREMESSGISSFGLADLYEERTFNETKVLDA